MCSAMMVQAYWIRRASEMLHRFSMDAMHFCESIVDGNSVLNWPRQLDATLFFNGGYAFLAAYC